jgi:hypothetical protein
MNALSPDNLIGKLNFLQNSKEWPKWEYALKLDKWGGQKPSPIFAQASSNDIQLAFHLKIFLDNSGIDLGKINTIIEWGGGFGSGSKIVRRIGYTSQYIVYDLPQISLLQKAYLDHNLPEHNIDLVSEWPLFSPSIFLSTFGIAECPISERAQFLNCNPDWYLLSYGSHFNNEINNEEYFAKFQSENANYIWKQIKFGPVTYLIGERIGSKSNSDCPDSA